MRKKGSIYFTTTDPEGRTISLHSDTWGHIKKKHPEIKRPTEISSTIKKPDVIQENTSRQSLIYTTISRPDLFVNVVAKMDDTYTIGRVSTAHLTKKLLRGSTIWTRKK